MSYGGASDVAVIQGFAHASAAGRCTQCLRLLTRNTSMHRCPLQAPLYSTAPTIRHGFLSLTPLDDDEGLQYVTFQLILDIFYASASPIFKYGVVNV